MAVAYKGLVIKFGGDTTELQGALKKVQSASRETQSDLRDINKALKFDPGNTELLQQKVRALNGAYEETKQKLDAYKQALAQLESKKQSGAKLTATEERQYDSLKRSIMQCERQLESYGDEMRAASKEAEGSKTALYKVGQTLEDNADKLSSVGSKVSGAGVAISGGVIGAATALTGLADSQEEAIQQTGQLETAFKNAGGTVEQAQSVYGSFYRILGESDTATEASQNLARLTTNQKELNQWANIAAGAYATFGDALPLENLAEAAQETAHTSTVTGGLADALNWSTASADQWSAALSGHSGAQAAFNNAIAEGATKEDAFNEALAACKDEQERASLITETLTGLYGDAGKQYQETNKDLLSARDAQNEMSDSMRKMGEAAMPVKQAVMEIGSEVLGRLAPALQAASDWYKALSPAQQDLVTNLALGTVAFGGAASAVGKLIGAAGDIAPRLKDAGAGWSAFTGLISANPIGLGIAAVSAAVAGLTWFFTQTETGKKMWSDFTGWLTDKWEGVQSFFSGVPAFWSGVWDDVTGRASDFVSDCGKKWDDLKSNTSSTWENIKSTVGSKAQGAFSAVSGWWSSVKSDTASKFSGVAQTIQGNMNTARSVGSSAAGALQAAMSGDWSTARARAADAFGAIKSGIGSNMSAAQSAAVSIADRIGSKLGFPGLGSKVSSVFNSAGNAIRSPIQSAWNAISGIPGRIMGAFSGIRISLPQIKMPHFNVKWNDFGPIKLPSVSVNWYARGGYFDRASIIGVGERGGEYVAPEKQLWSFIESAVNNAFSGIDREKQDIGISVTVYATVADGVDAYETGKQIGLGIESRLKQRGVSVAA